MERETKKDLAAASFTPFTTVILFHDTHWIYIYVPDHIFQIFFPQFNCYYPDHELLVSEKTLMLASTPSCGKFSAKNLEVSFHAIMREMTNGVISFKNLKTPGEYLLNRISST